jgi:putative transposase
MVSNKNLTEDIMWQKEIPYDTRQLAIKEAVTAYHSNLEKMKRGSIDKFELHFKTKNNPVNGFHINDTACKVQIKNNKKCLSLFPTILKNNSILRTRTRISKLIPNSIDRDLKMSKDHGKYYIIITTEKYRDKELHKNRENIALDPGVRAFQTGYSDEGVALEFGKRHQDNLKKLHNKLDALRSVRDKTKLKITKRNLKKKIRSVYSKVENVVKDLHYESANILAKNFSRIFLPTFETQKMLIASCICSKTKRMMQSLSHYRFKQRLAHVCYRYGTTLHVVDESFTTKTCGKCGCLNNVGGDKIYKCSSCNYICHRDIHGARNIFIKVVTEQWAATRAQ